MQVHFKTPQVKSFFSQHDHFEYSQIAVKQDVHEEEALVTGDYWQVDPLRRELIRHHQLRKNKYMVLLVLDGATNLLWATAQNSLNNKETIQALRLWTDEHNCMPKAIVGDEAFFQEDFLTYYRTHGIKECPCGSRTPWPNRAESAVRLFKRQWQIMSKNLEDDRFKGITIREAVKRTVWARNTQLTVSGYSPLEIATGRRPPDLLDIETSDPAQLSVDPLPEDKTQLELQRLALRAHQEARQAADLRHDMAK